MSLPDPHTEMKRAVFTEVMALHPDHLTEDELLRKLGSGRGGAEGEAMLDAIRDLQGSGLLRVGDAVVPTYAAICAAFLLCEA